MIAPPGRGARIAYTDKAPPQPGAYGFSIRGRTFRDPYPWLHLVNDLVNDRGKPKLPSPRIGAF